MVKIILLVLVAELFTTAGQVLFKKNTNEAGTYNLRDPKMFILFLRHIISRPQVWGGFLAMSLGLIAWLMALAQGDLSLVFPMGSIQYLLILLSAHFFLGEKIDRMKLAGTFLVVLGIFLLTASMQP
jgi:uncharacterized membrane protein